jgi:hypothetical protein
LWKRLRNYDRKISEIEKDWRFDCAGIGLMEHLYPKEFKKAKMKRDKIDQKRKEIRRKLKGYKL